MKKILASVLVLVTIVGSQFVGQQANAENVNLETARQAGARYWAFVNGKMSMDASLLSLESTLVNEAQGVPAMYIFNIGEDGFVIVSGSTSAEPIVAFSTEGALDINNIPPAMEYWLNGFASAVIEAQNEDTKPSVEIADKWASLTNGSSLKSSKSAKTFLLKDFWTQEAPFNNQCPMDESVGRRSIVGCVATSMSQIIHYWRYPVKGKSSKSWHYWSQTGTVNYAQTKYDYSLMPDTLKNTWTDAQKEETSKLCFHVGVAVSMDYGADASGSHVDNHIVTALKLYYKYPSATYQSRGTNTSSWISMCRQEILNRRPIMYAAYDNESDGADAGHAFVCDGSWADDTNQFHFNWGWGGPRYTANCWCNLATPALNAAGYHFNSTHRAIVNFAPPADSNRFAGINDVRTVSTYPAYPNPAVSSITIPYEVNGQNAVEMVIYNVAGMVMDRVMLKPGETSVEVNVANYPSGVYVYRANGQAKKFMVQ